MSSNKKPDYFKLMQEGWEEVDINITECSVCHKTKLCKILEKGNLYTAVCEDCFKDDTNRFKPEE
jgi:hypothetical protein